MHKINNSKPSILILGAYGRGNIGDDVFIICAAELFKNYDVHINSANDSLLPKQVSGSIHTISTTNVSDVFKKMTIFLRTKKIVYWGGDLWVELYGTKHPRQLLYKMILLNTLLRLFGKKIYYIGCGVGVLRGYSLRLARLSAHMAEKVVLREQRSATVMRLPYASILPDIAINLPYNIPTRHRFPNSRPFHIVISVLWSIPNPEVNFQRLIESIAVLINSLSAKDFEVTLLPMHINDEQEFDDLWAAEKLNDLLDHKASIYKVRNIESIAVLLRECDLLIGARLHTDILAILNGTPSIGVSYRPKVRSFFVDNGINEYCLDLDSLDTLSPIFNKIHDNYSKISKQFYAVSNRNFAMRIDYTKLIDSL